MQPNEQIFLIVFYSYNHAAYLYRQLVKENFKVELINTPCKLIQGCSQSLKFPEQYLSEIKKKINDMNLAIAGIYQTDSKGNNLIYTKI